MTRLLTDQRCQIAAAKVNLTLRVRGRRRDGYHDLESLVVFADFGDRLTAVAGSGGTSVSGPFAAALTLEGGDTLTTKALAFWERHIGTVPAMRLELEKNLPVAAGIGGGSADAAALLRLLETASGERVPASLYPAMVTEIGADVPACLQSVPLMMRTRGEEIERLGEWPAFPALLVNCGARVATRDVFTALRTRHNETVPFPPDADRLSALEYIARSGNDLMRPALALCPQIGEVIGQLSHMEGARHAGLSGSGPTCFALFEDAQSAQRAADKLAREMPDWWVRPVMLMGAP